MGNSKLEEKGKALKGTFPQLPGKKAKEGGSGDRQQEAGAPPCSGWGVGASLHRSRSSTAHKGRAREKAPGRMVRRAEAGPGEGAPGRARVEPGPLPGRPLSLVALISNWWQPRNSTHRMVSRGN